MPVRVVMAAEVTPSPVIVAEVITALTAFMLVNEAEPYPTVVPVRVVIVADVEAIVVIVEDVTVNVVMDAEVDVSVVSVALMPLI